MLKGHVFNLQTFTSECFALFIDTFLNKNNGIVKGCTLSNTTNSVTILAGYFVVEGRFLQIIDNETINNITNDGYYSLICEIDLEQTNTTTKLNQANIKIITNASDYPVVIQENLNDNGSIYQYEFARFRVVSGTISYFTDKRTFVDIQSVFDLIQDETGELITQIQSNLNDVLDESLYLLKTGGNVNGNIEVDGSVKCDSVECDSVTDATR